MKPRRFILIASLATTVVWLLVLWLQPMLLLRTSYVATPVAQLQATLPPKWNIVMLSSPTAASQMCKAVNMGDSPEHQGQLIFNYVHWDEFLVDGKVGRTSSLICSFYGEHSARFQRWDWRIKNYGEIEIIWHGRRQRGDVNVPNTIF